jgi:hypothetical protein
MPASDMNLTKPTVGGSSGTWGTTINANLDNIGEHDHTSGKGVKVPSGGININAALEFNANDATELGRVAFDSSVTTSNLVRSLFVDADGDLNYRNENGVDVQITENTTLDVGDFGGIVGDYATGNAALYYDNTGKLYRMLQSAPLPNVWAGVDCGGLKLYEKASGITNGITIQSPTSLSAAYSLTLPTALPGSTSLLQVTSTGAVQATTSPTVSDLKLSSIRTKNLHIASAEINRGAGTPAAFSSDFSLITHGNTAADVAAIPLNLDIGDRVREVRFYIRKLSGATSIDCSLRYITASSGAVTTAGTASNSASAPGRVTVTIASLTETLATGRLYHLVVNGNGGTTDEWYGCEVDYDRP